jgi:hypothetical protein
MESCSLMSNLWLPLKLPLLASIEAAEWPTIRVVSALNQYVYYPRRCGLIPQHG